MKCKFCEKQITNKNMQGYCQSCYRYFIIENKTTYKTPPKGEIYYTENGDVVCPICGKAFRKLGNHLCQAHNISTNEAFKQFNWFRRGTKATNIEYRKHMKIIQDPKTLENLKLGEQNRFYKNHKKGGRKKGKPQKVSSYLIKN